MHHIIKSDLFSDKILDVITRWFTHEIMNESQDLVNTIIPSWEANYYFVLPVMVRQKCLIDNIHFNYRIVL